MPTQIQQINVCRRFSFNLDASASNNIITWCDASSPPSQVSALSSGFQVYRSIYIEDLHCMSNITSIAQAPFPDINSYDSSATQWATILNNQAEYPRKQANLLEFSNNAWQKIGNLVFQNRNEIYFPDLMTYFTSDRIFRIDEQTKFGIQFVDVGTGFLASQDLINIKYVMTETLSLIPNILPTNLNVAQNYNFSISTTNSILLTQNSNRLGLILQASDSNTDKIWIGFGNTAQIGAGLYLSPGAAWQMSMSESTLISAINAIAASNQTLYATEWIGA